MMPRGCAFRRVLGPLAAATALACTSNPTAETSCARPTAPVRIVRDDWGVPHIFGATTRDAIFGQGYAQAEDRLLQIDLMRRVARGRRAELLGESELAMDRLVRTLGIERAAAASLAALDAHTLCLIDAYVGGVNRRLAELRSGAVRKPADLTELDAAYVPPDWERLDVVAVATAALFSLSSDIFNDLVLTAAEKLVDAETYARVINFEPLVPAVTLADPATSVSPPQLKTGKPDAAGRVVLDDRAVQALARFAALGERVRNAFGPHASNNWVVAASKTGDGLAFMASDPHGAVAVASSFHEVHLVVANPAINAYGVAIAGAPSIHLGTNGHAAWSFTNYMSDVGDLYRETIDPDDEDAVMFNGASVPLAIRTERILVRPIGGAVADAVATEFRVAVVPHHGPILNDVLPDPLPLLLADAPISYRWSGYDTALAPRALARLLDVRDFAQFAEVLRDMHIGAQNSVFADRDGHIGYIAPGRFPLRSWDLHAHPPITPLPGAGGFEWDGYRDYDTLPRLLDPAWGFIGTANNDPNGQMADGDPFGPETFFGYNYDVGFRAHRIQVRLHEALAARAVTLADMESLQIDVYVEFADMLVPRMLTAAARRLTEVTTQGLNAAVATLAAWDRRATIESAGAAVFHQTVVRLISDFVAQPLLPPLRPMILGNPQYALRAVVRAIRSDDHHFFPQGADRAIVAALATARDDLAAFFGSSDPSAWHWGDMHVRKLTHVLGEAYGLGPIPAPGGFDVINRADFDYLDENGPEPLPYRIVDGPDMRMIVEVAGPDTRIRMMLPHGSSGDPASDHYDDQFALWVAGEYRDAAYSPAAVEASKRSEVTLR